MEKNWGDKPSATLNCENVFLDTSMQYWLMFYKQRKKFITCLLFCGGGGGGGHTVYVSIVDNGSCMLLCTEGCHSL